MKLNLLPTLVGVRPPQLLAQRPNLAWRGMIGPRPSRVIVFCAVALMSAPLIALDIIQTTDVSASSTSIQTFSPNLGTLNSVTESFNGGFSVANLGTCIPVTANGIPVPGASCTITYTVSVLSSFGSDFSGAIISVDDPTMAGANDVLGGSATITGSLGLSPSQFLGSSNPHIIIFLDETFHKVFAVQSQSHDASVQPDSSSTIVADTTLTGTWELDYNYTPTAAAPEPGSLVLLVTSLGTLFLLRVRLKRLGSTASRAC